MEQSECETLLNITGYLRLARISKIIGVKCFSIVGDSKQMIADGTLALLKTKDQIQLHLLQLQDFQFPLTKSIPCLRSNSSLLLFINSITRLLCTSHAWKYFLWVRVSRVSLKVNRL